MHATWFRSFGDADVGCSGGGLDNGVDSSRVDSGSVAILAQKVSSARWNSKTVTDKNRRSALDAARARRITGRKVLSHAAVVARDSLRGDSKTSHLYCF